MTVPVGVAAPVPLTVAVNVTGSPNVLVGAELARSTVAVSPATVWSAVALPPVKLPPPAYSATRVCVPTASPARVVEPCPDPSRVTVARVVDPSRTTTVPVGVPAPGGTAATVMEMATVPPNTDGSGVSVSVTETDAGATV